MRAVLPQPRADPVLCASAELDIAISLPASRLNRIQTLLAEGEVVILDPARLSQVRLTLPWHISTRRGRTEIISGDLSGPRPDPILIRALRNAPRMLRRDHTGMLVLDAAPATSYRLKLVRLAFLAPDIQREHL